MDAEISWRSHASFLPIFAAQLRLHQVQMVSAANFCIVRTEISTLCLGKTAPCLLAAFYSTLPFDSKSAVCRLALRHLSWRPQHPHILRGPHPRPSPPFRRRPAARHVPLAMCALESPSGSRRTGAAICGVRSGGGLLLAPGLVHTPSTDAAATGLHPAGGQWRRRARRRRARRRRPGVQGALSGQGVSRGPPWPGAADAVLPGGPSTGLS